MRVRNVLKKVVAIIVILVTLLCIPIINLAHSGRTDSSGGHKDNKNKSGLGPYHYHCGGHPAHLHDGGVCPFSNPAAPASTSSTSSSSTTTFSSSKTTTPKKVTATKVEIDLEELELLIGESKCLTATVSPSNAEDKTVTWKSSDKEIAMVDSEGEVLAIGIGETTITVTTANGKEANVKVKVNPIKVSEIKINETEITLKVDESISLTATVLPENATDKTIEWSSKNPEIATVENGKIKAIAAGITKIICLSKDEIKTEVNVIVEEIVEEETIEVVADTENTDDDSNKKVENIEEQTTTEITPIAGFGICIALASIVVLPIYGFKTRDKEEKFNFLKFVGNIFSYLVCFITLLFSAGVTSIFGLIIIFVTGFSVAPPISKIINQKIKGRYTVKIRTIIYILGLILIIVLY